MVVIILGILSTVAIFATGQFTEGAKETTCNAMFSSVASASEAKYANDGVYPASIAEIQTFFTLAGGAAWDATGLQGKGWHLTIAPVALGAGPPAISCA